MYKIYQVGNETLEDIARKTGTTVERLRQLNGIGTVIPGSYIIVPTSDMEYTTYIVKQGDNMYAIAREYGVDYASLLKLNGLEENDYIYPNQEILIPNEKVYVTGANETIKEVLNNSGKTLNDIKNINDLYLKEDQVIKF